MTTTKISSGRVDKNNLREDIFIQLLRSVKKSDEKKKHMPPFQVQWSAC